ncbi:MAG: hypothetical protein ACREHD_26790, partial [Pirellulales bacterium]
KYVDSASPAWSVRHVPDRGRSDAISELAWCLRPHERETLEVTYVPIDDERALALARMWEKADLDARPSIQKQPDGTVSVTIDVAKEKPGLWYPMVLYWSSGAK